MPAQAGRRARRALRRLEKSWCSGSRIQVLGRGDKWASASLPSLSELSVPLTAQHLHEKLLELKIYLRTTELKIYLRTSRAEVYLQLRQLEMKMLNCERYTRFGSCWFQRKMVCWGGVRPRPGPRLPPLEGGAGSHALGCLIDVLPPVRKSPVSRSCSVALGARHICRKGCGHGGGAWRAHMHGSDTPAYTRISCRCPSRACSPERTTCSMSACCGVIVVRRVLL